MHTDVRTSVIEHLKVADVDPYTVTPRTGIKKCLTDDHTPITSGPSSLDQAVACGGWNLGASDRALTCLSVVRPSLSPPQHRDDKRCRARALPCRQSVVPGVNRALAAAFTVRPSVYVDDSLPTPVRRGRDHRCIPIRPSTFRSLRPITQPRTESPTCRSLVPRSRSVRSGCQFDYQAP